MDQETQARQNFTDLISPYLKSLPERPPRRAGNVSRVELLGRDVWSQLNHYLLLITIDIGEAGIDQELLALLPPGSQVSAAGVFDSLQEWWPKPDPAQLRLPAICRRPAGRQVSDREFRPAAHRARRRRGDPGRRCGPSPGRLGHLPWPIAFVLGTAVGPTGRRRRPASPAGSACRGGRGDRHCRRAGRPPAAQPDRGPADRDRRLDPAGLRGLLPAEAIHASGVLAAVTAGLYLGWHRSEGAFSARSRLRSGAFWETLVFLINAALFVLVGLSFHTFSAQARGPVGRLVLTGLAVVSTVVVIRLTWMWAFGALIRPRRRDRGVTSQPGWRERLILGWSGMRGAITLAALLAVPEMTAAGRPLAGRDDIVYLGFAVIIVTLVAQGMTLPVLARRIRLSEHPSVADAERQARLQVTEAALRYLGQACVSGELPAELTDGLQAQYLARLHRLEATTGDEDPGGEVTGTAAADLALRRELIALQRRTLGDLRQQGRIGVTTLRSIELDLDFEEARLPPV